MSPGKLICIEGGEGAGKSTQLKKLLVAFPDIVATREPGGTPYAEKIRHLLLIDEDGEGSSPQTQFALFWAARADHIHRFILPALEAGKTVVTDRFDLSTYAYQLCGKQAPGSLLALFWQMRQVYVVDMLPKDFIHYIYLDIQPEVGLERISKRKGEVTHFDRESLDFHQRVYAGGHEFLRSIVSTGSSRQDPNSYIIDASQAQYDVHKDVVAAISQILTA